MKRPYIITSYNEKEEFASLKAEVKINNPLEFLELTKINGEFIILTYFDISEKSEFVLIDDSLIGKVTTVLTDFGFKIIVKDVTEDLLCNKIDLTNAKEETKKAINDYYYYIFEIDDVLDKINNKIKLNEFDKLILENKKP